ncbi:cell division protein FtsJ [Simplicispira metamorpha]|uniref:Ribosomal RNA large subunit methyltransferase E n=2 Tax=Comamonadaceae TaxID=80864 RepID=A0A4R2NB18_9BURK|nr:cell division protein FtsJ [Simplicispira metamorpha]
MNIVETIERAVEKVGSQRKLAELVGTPEQNLSGFKKGRPCSYQKHAEIAAAAGMHEEARHILIQGIADSLRDDVEHEAQAKAGLLAMLQAFPLEQTPPEPVMKVKTQSKKVNKAWLNDHVNDTYVKLAKLEGFRARAAYKLKEIDEQFGLIRPGQIVVDLGSTPGAWSQYVRRRLSPQGAASGTLNGTIISLDILPMEPVEGVLFIQGDFREPDVLAQLEEAMQGRQADVVVSDMAPNLSGIGATDAARIEHLVELAVDFASQHLKPEGALVVKLFHGGAYAPLVQLFKDTFRLVKPVKPKASRDKSSETFLVGIGLKKTV